MVIRVVRARDGRSGERRETYGPRGACQDRYRTSQVTTVQRVPNASTAHFREQTWFARYEHPRLPA